MPWVDVWNENTQMYDSVWVEDTAPAPAPEPTPAPILSVDSTFVTEITTNSARLNASIQSNVTITEYGFFYAINGLWQAAPLMVGWNWSGGPTTFSNTLDGLPPDSQIDFRAFLRYSGGEVYGAVVSFRTLATVAPIPAPAEFRDLLVSYTKV